MRYLGLDVGKVRIGVAVSDATGMIARPLATVMSAGLGTDVKAVVELATRESVSGIIVGHPIGLQGQIGSSVRMAEAFAEALRAAAPATAVSLWDERFTTKPAQGMIARRGGRRPLDRRGREAQRSLTDRMAAAVMLQSFLDAHPAS